MLVSQLHRQVQDVVEDRSEEEAPRVCQHAHTRILLEAEVDEVCKTPPDEVWSHLSCVSGVATAHNHDPCPLQARPSKMVLVQHVDKPIKARFAASRLWETHHILVCRPHGRTSARRRRFWHFLKAIRFVTCRHIPGPPRRGQARQLWTWPLRARLH